MKEVNYVLLNYSTEDNQLLYECQVCKTKVVSDALIFHTARHGSFRYVVDASAARIGEIA